MTTSEFSAIPSDPGDPRPVNPRLLAAMSHEIRTPLYGMLGTLELLSMTDLSALQRQHVTTVTASSHVLLQLLDDLLDYSRIEAGQFSLDAVPFDAAELAGSVVRAQAPLAMRKGVVLACELPPDLPWLVGDPLRVRQVVANLVRNAIAFTVQGRITLRMWREPLPPAPGKVRLLLEVADTGIGIAADLLPGLFEPFVRGAALSAHHPRGAGLGLAICRRLARLMGGDIAVASTPGAGSRFTVALVLAAGERPASSASRGDAPAMPSLPRLGLNVLVVEDHPYNRLLLRQQLEQLGCTVQLAGNGAEGLAACADWRFDVVVTDVQMPVMDGYTFSRELRAAGNPVRIVALTAGSGDGEPGRCHAAGMDRCLSKPVLLPALAACLQGLVPGSHAPAARLATDAPDAAAALLAQTLRADLDALCGASGRGDLHAVQAHAHRMRGALAHCDRGHEAAQLCRELEAGAAWALQAAHDRIGDLRLYLDACLAGGAGLQGAQHAQGRDRG